MTTQLIATEPNPKTLAGPDLDSLRSERATAACAEASRGSSEQSSHAAERGGAANSSETGQCSAHPHPAPLSSSNRPAELSTSQQLLLQTRTVFRAVARRVSPRRVLNFALKYAGYRIEALDRFQMHLDELRVRQGENFFFVQIGANDGIRFDGLYDFVTRHRVRGLVVEPLTYYFERLRENYRRYPGVVAVRTAIHASEKTATIHVPDPSKSESLPDWADGIGSLNPEHHIRLQIPSHCIVRETVPCMPFENLMRANRVTSISLLQIDTEGYDTEIIKMIDFSKWKPKIIKFEHVSASAADLTAVMDILRANRYKIWTQETDTIALLR
jgi:FkbM family methyltransferase